MSYPILVLPRTSTFTGFPGSATTPRDDNLNPPSAYTATPSYGAHGHETHSPLPMSRTSANVDSNLIRSYGHTAPFSPLGPNGFYVTNLWYPTPGHVSTTSARMNNYPNGFQGHSSYSAPPSQMTTTLASMNNLNGLHSRIPYSAPPLASASTAIASVPGNSMLNTNSFISGNPVSLPNANPNAFQPVRRPQARA